MTSDAGSGEAAPDRHELGTVERPTPPVADASGADGPDGPPAEAPADHAPTKRDAAGETAPVSFDGAAESGRAVRPPATPPPASPRATNDDSERTVAMPARGAGGWTDPPAARVPGASRGAESAAAAGAAGASAGLGSRPRPGTEPLRRPAEPPRRPAATAATASAAGGRRAPARRARLTLTRLDPWSVLKFSFVYALTGLIVILVAVAALYALVDAMGVIDSIRSFLQDVDQPKSGQGIAGWLSFGRVMTVAAVVGAINVVLLTAFATLTAFIYNICTDLVGGIEVTLAERG